MKKHKNHCNFVKQDKIQISSSIKSFVFLCVALCDRFGKIGLNHKGREGFHNGHKVKLHLIFSEGMPAF